MNAQPIQIHQTLFLELAHKSPQESKAIKAKSYAHAFMGFTFQHQKGTVNLKIAFPSLIQ